MNVFVVDNVDYSKNVVAGTYEVNQIDKYVEWVDGFGGTHRDQRTPKVEGSFDMFFKTQSEYENFLSSLERAKFNAEKAYTITIKRNNIHTENIKSINAFVDFKPVRDVGIGWRDFFKQFKVEIMEC